MITRFLKLAFLLLLVLGLATTAGCRNTDDDNFFPFSIEVESIQIEGSVSDSLTPPVAVTLDGNSVSLVGNQFNEHVDMSATSQFTLEARDEAGNTAALTVEVE